MSEKKQFHALNDGHNYSLSTAMMKQICVVYSFKLDELARDFTTSIGVRRKLQSVIERHYEFFISLREDGLKLVEIAQLLATLGLLQESTVKAKSVQSALARAAKRANYRSLHTGAELHQTASDCSERRQTALNDIKLKLDDQSRVQQPQTAQRPSRSNMNTEANNETHNTASDILQPSTNRNTRAIRTALVARDGTTELDQNAERSATLGHANGGHTVLFPKPRRVGSLPIWANI
jgi:hypothetical protein